jgi:tetratricopeptide (TPR) repeat protein
MRLGDESLALDLLGEIVARDPQHDEAEFWIGRILYDQGKSLEARVHAERARELNPFEPGPWYLVSQVLFDLGQDEAARSALERWRVLTRASDELRTLRGTLRVEPRRFDLWRRVLVLEESIGNALWRAGDLAGAKAWAREREQACGSELACWQRLERHFAALRDRVNQVRARERAVALTSR